MGAKPIRPRPLGTAYRSTNPAVNVRRGLEGQRDLRPEIIESTPNQTATTHAATDGVIVLA